MLHRKEDRAHHRCCGGIGTALTERVAARTSTSLLDTRSHQAGSRGEKMSTVMRPSARPNSLCRREFLTMLRALRGLVLIAGLPGVIKAEQTKKYGADTMAHGWTDNPLAFIVIGEDDVVTIVVNRPEMGQGGRTGM